MFAEGFVPGAHGLLYLNCLERQRFMESAKSTATYKFVLDIVLTVVVTLVWGSSVRRLRILNFQSCDHPMALQHDSTAAGWRISECSPAVQGRYVPFVCQTHSTVTKIILDGTTSEGGHNVTHYTGARM